MPEKINDKYYAAIVVDWLRKCSENPLKAGKCNKCPFDDGGTIAWIIYIPQLRIFWRSLPG